MVPTNPPREPTNGSVAAAGLRCDAHRNRVAGWGERRGLAERGAASPRSEGGGRLARRWPVEPITYQSRGYCQTSTSGATQRDQVVTDRSCRRDPRGPNLRQPSQAYQSLFLGKLPDHAWPRHRGTGSGHTGADNFFVLTRILAHADGTGSSLTSLAALTSQSSSSDPDLAQMVPHYQACSYFPGALFSCHSDYTSPLSTSPRRRKAQITPSSLPSLTPIRASARL